MANYSQGAKYGCYDKLKKDKKSSALASLVICIYLCIMSFLLLIQCHHYGIAPLIVKCMHKNEYASDEHGFGTY